MIVATLSLNSGHAKTALKMTGNMDELQDSTCVTRVDPAVNAAFVGDDGKVMIDLPLHDNNVPSSSIITVKQEIDYSTATITKQFGAALAAAFSAFLLGTTFGWSSPVQPQLQQIDTTIRMNEVRQTSVLFMLYLDDDQMSWVGSLLNIGALFGALSGGLLMDKFGRRFILMTMTSPYIVGWLMISLSIDPIMLYVGRVIVGFAGGVCAAIAPCYIGEISTPTMRGTAGLFYSMNRASGILVTSCMGVWLDWRWLSAICTIEPLILLVALSFVPESPYYLVKKGRQSDARRAMQWLRGPNYSIEAELNQITARAMEDSQEVAKLSDFYKPWVFKPILIGVALMVLQQFSGLNAASFNATEIFRMADLNFNRLFGVVAISAVQVVAVIVSSSVLVKRFYRRTLFLVSVGLACMSMLSLGVFFYYLDSSSSQSLANFKWIPLASLIVFFSAIGMGLGGLPWLISSEILPAKFRGPGSSIVAFFNFLMSFIVTKTFIDMQRLMTHAGVFWFYSLICFVGILFGLFLLPETKDKTSNQIQAYFNSDMKS